jgi:hypothetical protein
MLKIDLVEMCRSESMYTNLFADNTKIHISVGIERKVGFPYRICSCSMQTLSKTNFMQRIKHNYLERYLESVHDIYIDKKTVEESTDVECLNSAKRIRMSTLNIKFREKTITSRNCCPASC